MLRATLEEEICRTNCTKNSGLAAAALAKHRVAAVSSNMSLCGKIRENLADKDIMRM